MLAVGVRPQNSLCCCAAPLKQLRPVRSRSVGMLRCPRAPRPLRFSARTEGMRRRFGPVLRSAWEPSPLPSPRGRGRNSGGLLMGTSPAIVRVELVQASLARRFDPSLSAQLRVNRGMRSTRAASTGLRARSAQHRASTSRRTSPSPSKGEGEGTGKEQRAKGKGQRAKGKGQSPTTIRLTPALLPLPLGEGRGEGSQGRAKQWPVWTSTPLLDAPGSGTGRGGVGTAECQRFVN